MLNEIQFKYQVINW